MAVPIRTMVFAGILLVTYIWAIIGFIGSYSVTNNLPLNSTLQQQYLAIVGNSSTTGISSALSGISNQTANQGGQLGGTGIINDIGSTAQVIKSIPAVYNAVAYLVATPFRALGFPISQPMANILLLIVLIIILAIFSAIFLFPI